MPPTSHLPRRTETPITTAIAVLQGLRCGPSKAQALIAAIDERILEEHDGPMLRHGLQEIAGQRLHVPGSAAHKPRKDFLEERYALFKKVG